MPSALDILNALQLLPVKLTAAQWEAIQADVRERAFFMALVDEATTLQAHRDAVRSIMDGTSSKTDAQFAIDDYLDEIGYQAPEGKEGTIQDLRSNARQNLVLETNQAMVAGAAQRAMYKGSVAFPAQRLVRAGQRKVKRDWPTRWRLAYAQVGGMGASAEEMVALNDSPIWTALSRFGQPHAPFDYNSGMRTRPVTWEEAERLGLVTREDAPAIAARAHEPEPMNAGLQASGAGLDADILAQLQVMGGGNVRVQGDTIAWQGGGDS